VCSWEVLHSVVVCGMSKPCICVLWVCVMCVGPNHPDAHKLAQRFHAQAAKRRHQSSASGAAAAVADNMSEDDQLAMALAMSVEVRACA
jgi:hypothetical protein